MIDYKLAKQLKKAGSPQEGEGKLEEFDFFIADRDYKVGESIPINSFLYFPTLSELIDFVDGNDRMKEITQEYAEKALLKL